MPAGLGSEKEKGSIGRGGTVPNADPQTLSAMPAVSAEAGENLDPPLSDLYRDYCRPELGAYLKALRLDVPYQRASGNYLYYSSGGEEVAVLDMLGGYGALILGHNHPELVEVAKGLLDRQVPIHAQASVRSASALLAQRLSRHVACSSGDAHVVTFANSGAEAVEAAIKHAELEIRLEVDRTLKEVDRRFARAEKQLGRSARVSSEDWPRTLRTAKASPATVTLEEARVDAMRHNEEVFQTPPTFLALEGSFHGKTVGALQLTANSFYRTPFRRIGLRVRFLKKNDIGDFEQALVEGTLTYFDVTVDPGGRVRLFERPLLNVAACFLEPIQGEGGVRPLAKEYLSQLQERCSARNVPLVIDEIQSGMGRTGRFLCCHKLGVRGDYYLLSKGLGGGLAKISALIISRRRYRPEFSLLHTSTFAEDDFSSAFRTRPVGECLCPNPIPVPLPATDFRSAHSLRQTDSFPCGHV